MSLLDDILENPPVTNNMKGMDRQFTVCLSEDFCREGSEVTLTGKTVSPPAEQFFVEWNTPNGNRVGTYCQFDNRDQKFLFVELYTKGAREPRATCIVELNDEFEVGAIRDMALLQSAGEELDEERFRDRLSDYVPCQKYVGPLLYCLHVLSCTNVSLETSSPRKPGKRGKRGKVTKRPLVEVRRIKVRQTTSKGGSSTQDKRPLRRHVVRGHVKNYGEKGLFGKIKGSWYWPPSLRGEAKNGFTITEGYDAE